MMNTRDGSKVKRQLMQDRDGGQDEPECKRQKTYMLACYLHWTTENVVDFLKDHDLPHHVVEKFIFEEITGKVLTEIEEQQLKDMAIEKAGHRLLVMKVIKDLVKASTVKPQVYHHQVYHQVFNDSIHGHIEMHPLSVAVIDTAQFQRLRWIKQLGVAYMVYPGASHNRFEHSLGVAHLAGEFARVLRKHQPELNITDEDVVCLELAGLCHDLGHGPFSHVFDNKFRPRIYPESKWKHEVASLKMFEYMLESNDLRKNFHQYGLNENDIIFVKECIDGPQGPDKTFIGRTKEKQFLYEIVANKKTGIDVDKWDYFARDCHHLGLKSTFDHKRYMYFARVIEGQICCRDKEARNLYDMFQSRANLHRMAYQHKTNQNLENMLVQALVKANDHLITTAGSGTDRKEYKLADTVDDMEAYCKVTDNIFLDILNSSDPNLEASRQLLHDMQKRRLFKFIGETRPSVTIMEPNEASVYLDELVSQFKVDNPSTTVNWKEELIGQVLSLDFGMGGKNPIDKMRFYSKEDPDKVFEIKKSHVSMMLPQNFSDCRFRLYCKSPDTLLHEKVGICFTNWCESKGFLAPKLGGIEFTPQKQKDVDGSTNQPSPALKRRESLAMN